MKTFYKLASSRMLFSVFLVFFFFTGFLYGQNTINVPGDYTSIQEAINSADPGDVIEIDAGYYEENLAAWKDLEITKSLTLQGAGSGQTIIGLTEGKQNGVEIRGSDLDVHIEGITFTRRTMGEVYATNFGLRIAETTSSFNSLVLRDVEVSHAQARNVFFGAAGTFLDVIIEDCNFHHAGSWGVSFAGPVTGLNVIGSVFADNGQVDPNQGIGLDFTSPGPHQDILIEDSEFNDNLTRGMNATNIQNVIVRNVAANNNGSTGFQIWNWAGNTSNVIFENCTVTDNGQDGVQIGAEPGMSVSGITFDGGTYSNNTRNNLRFHNAGGAVEDLTIKNVIMSRLASTPGSAEALVFVQSVDGIIIESNDFTQDQIHWNIWLQDISAGNVEINKNTFKGTHGIAAWVNVVGALINISNNSIETTTLALFNHVDNDAYEAACNWFGSNEFSDVNDAISGEVEFLPFLIEDPNGSTFSWSGSDTYSCAGEGLMVLVDSDGNKTLYLDLQDALDALGASDGTPGSGGLLKVINEDTGEVNYFIKDENDVIFILTLTEGAGGVSGQSGLWTVAPYNP